MRSQNLTTKYSLILTLAIVGTLAYLPIFKVHEAKAATVLPTLIPGAGSIPNAGDATDSGTIETNADALCNATDCYTSIDDTIAGADDATTFLRNVDNNAATRVQGFELTDMPTDFSDMETLSADIRVDTSGTRSNDNITLYAQIFEDGGSTALTDQVQICAFAASNTCGTSYSTITINFSLQGNNTKTVWDSAELHLTWVTTRTQGPDGITVDVSAAEIDGTYNAAAGITISGTLFQNNGSSTFDCSAANKTITLKINGAGTHTTECSAAGGTWSIASVSTIAAAGQIVTIWVDEAGDNAATVTKTTDGSSNITGVSLYQNHLIVRQEGSATSTTNTNLGEYDSDDDPEIPFSANSGELRVRADTKLFVWYEKTFAPGGMVVTATSTTASLPNGDVQIGSNATLSMETNPLWIGGDYSATSTLATLTLSPGQNTYLTATSTAFSFNPASGENFENLTFTGSGGSWRPSANFTVNQNLTIAAGTLDLNTNDPNVTVSGDLIITGTLSASGSGTFTLAGDFQNHGTFTHNSGTITLAPTSTSVIYGPTTFNNLTNTTPGTDLIFETSGSPVFTIAGTLTITGIDGDPIDLFSDVPDTQWTVHFNSTQTNVDYARIQDAACDGGSANANLPKSVVDLDNNGTCWKFNRPPPGGAKGGGSPNGTGNNPNGGGDTETGGDDGGDGSDGSPDGTGTNPDGGGDTQTGGDTDTSPDPSP